MPEASERPVQYTFILEHGFHTNQAECSYLSDSRNRKAIAAAKASAFSEFFYGVTSSVPNIQTTQVMPQDDFYMHGVVNVCDDDTLNLRLEPNSDYDNVKARLTNGTIVTVLEAIANQTYGDVWYKIFVTGIKFLSMEVKDTYILTILFHPDSIV